MIETKMDPLAESFDGVETAGVPQARPMLAGAERAGGDSGFDGWLRSGAGGLEMKALSGASDAAGGYAIPREIDGMVDSTLASMSPIRAIANVVKVGSSGYRKLISSGGIASGWAAETAARGETATPTFNEIHPPMGDLYANPAASQTMLDDAAFDVETWLAQEIASEFARAEGQAFVTGTGTNQPKGFLTQPVSSAKDDSRPFGTIQYLPSGVNGDFDVEPEEALIDLIQSLRAPYRQGAVFVMNAATLGRIRKFKTSDGQLLWQPGIAVGQPATLLGYPLVEAEAMPDIAANSLSVAFGNFKAGYLIAERSETQILRDPYSNKPYVHFYAVKRLGGMVSNSEAIKLMKFAAA